jgi:hypothetical protein
MTLGPWPALLLAAVACAHGASSGLPGSGTLSLRDGRELSVDGTFGGARAEVRLAVEEPRSRVSAACFGKKPEAQTQVRLPVLSGGWETLPELTVANVGLGERTLPAFRAAVTSEPRDCVVWLGLDVLGRSVLDVDLVARTLTVAGAAPGLPKDAESVVVDLTRAPDTDRLLVPVQLTGASATVLQTLVLGTAQSTQLAALPARALGAEHVVRVVQLAPGWEACDVPVRQRPDWTRAPAIGVLGPEGWGATRVLLDIVQARLTLIRGKGAQVPPCRDQDTPAAGKPPGPVEAEPR